MPVRLSKTLFHCKRKDNTSIEAAEHDLTNHYTASKEKDKDKHTLRNIY